MSLVGTSALNSVAVAVKAASSLLLNKVLAIHVGPSGYAVIGQFQNFLTSINSLATAGLGSGVTQLTAKYGHDRARQADVWRTAGSISGLGSALVGLALIVFRESLAGALLGDAALAGIFLFLGAGFASFTGNAFLVAILNGRKDFRRHFWLSIASSLLTASLCGAFAWRWGLYGALVSIPAAQAMAFLAAVVMLRGEPWFRLRNLVGRVRPEALRSLSGFAAMALTSAVLVPLGQVSIRGHVVRSFGWEAAGHWEAMMRVSALYLMLVTTPLSVYFLPRVAELKEHDEVRAEVVRVLRFAVPVAAAAATAVFLTRDLAIDLLFTTEFAGMRPLFGWQLLGDVMKVAAWVFGYTMIGRAMAQTYIVSEVVFVVSGVVFAILFSASSLGLRGVQVAYFINNLLYFVVSGVILFRPKRRAHAV